MSCGSKRSSCSSKSFHTEDTLSTAFQSAMFQCAFSHCVCSRSLCHRSYSSSSIFCLTDLFGQDVHQWHLESNSLFATCNMQYIPTATNQLSLLSLTFGQKEMTLLSRPCLKLDHSAANFTRKVEGEVSSSISFLRFAF